MSKPVFIFSSKYSQRMRKLSCKIFNEFYVPELSRKELEYSTSHPPVQQWAVKWFSDQRAYERNIEKPLDLNTDKNYKYYPAHPQIRSLSHTLREYGLFRDEHRDFNEAMKAIAIAKGKPQRPVFKREPKNGSEKK